MVSDVLLPFISLLPFIDRNLPQKFLVLRRGPNGRNGYNTIQQAESDGAVTMTYGSVQALRDNAPLTSFIDALSTLSSASSPLVLFFTF
jgi:hypothetical protein